MYFENYDDVVHHRAELRFHCVVLRPPPKKNPKQFNHNAETDDKR